MTCEPVPIANAAFEDLLAGEDLTVPDLSAIQIPTFASLDADTWSSQPSISLEDLTTGQTGGSGVFDRLMTSVTAHLDRERAAGRITNNDFAKSYVDFSSAAMATAVQFLLQKDQALWQGIAARTAAQLAIVQLTTAAVALEEAKIRVQLMTYQANSAKVEMARGKMALATAQVEYCTAEYQLQEILPKQALLLLAQENQTEAQTNQVEAQTLMIGKQTLQTEAQTLNITNTTTNLLPQQVRGATAQADGQILQNTTVIPKQATMLDRQIELTKEQFETQRAQTLDTRSDGIIPVTGTLGKQKELHAQQIVSYQRDSQLKAARPFIDAWITMKTIDEGTLPPTGFNNANLDAILAVLRADNDLT
jgi:hypothetical protein